MYISKNVIFAATETEPTIAAEHGFLLTVPRTNKGPGFTAQIIGVFDQPGKGEPVCALPRPMSTPTYPVEGNITGVLGCPGDSFGSISGLKPGGRHSLLAISCHLRCIRSAIYVS